MTDTVPDAVLRGIDEIQRGVDALLEPPPADPLLQIGIYLAAATVLIRALARQSERPMPREVVHLLADMDTAVMEVARRRPDAVPHESRPS